MRTYRTSLRSALLLVVTTLLLVSGLSALSPATAADPTTPPDPAAESSEGADPEGEADPDPVDDEPAQGESSEPSRPAGGSKARQEGAVATAAGDGVLNLELTPVDLTDGSVITDASNGTHNNQITYRVQFSCTTAACDGTQVRMSPAPPDPHGLLPAGEWILEYATWVPPATGGTISGTDITGKLVNLGNLPAGTSGTFSVTYGYQPTRNREIPNGSFYPEGFDIAMSATVTSATAVAPVTADAADVTWHIGTPTGPTATLTPNNGSLTADVPVTYRVAVNPGNIVVNPGANLAGSADLVATGNYQIVYTLPPQAVIQAATDGGVIDNVNHTVTWTKGSLADPSYGARGGWGLAAMSGFNSGGPAVNNNLVGADDDAFWQPRDITVVFPGENFPEADANGCNFATTVTSNLDVTVNYLDTARTERTLDQSMNARVACTDPFGGLAVDKRIAFGLDGQYQLGDGNLGGRPEVYAINATPAGDTDTGVRQWRVRVDNLGNVDATAVIDEPDLVKDHLKVHSIFAYAYTGAPASWRATVDWVDNTGATGTAVLANNQSVVAEAGRWFVSARTTAPLPAGRILPTDNTETFMSMGYGFRVSEGAPIGEEITNTAPVALNYPADADGDGAPDDYEDLQGNPLPTRSLSLDAVRTARYTRPAPSLLPSFTGAPVVAGGGDPKVGTEVTYSMRGRTENVWPGTQIRPQLVFVAPPGWDIVRDSAQFTANGDGATSTAPPGTTFEYATRTIDGVARQVVVATWPASISPSSTVNENWPTLSVKATPTSAAVPGTGLRAQVWAGDESGTWTTGVNRAYVLDPTEFRPYSSSVAGVADTPDVDGDSNTAEWFGFANSLPVIVAATDGIRVIKELCVPDTGAADGCNWVSDSSQMAGVPVDAADVKYRVTVRNTGNTTLRDVVAYDVLPYPGDTSLLPSASPRGSEFSMSLASIESSSPGLTLAYSASTNPVRPEVYPGAPGAVDDWSASAAGKKALRIRVDGDLAANTERQVVFLAAVAPGASAGEVACNTAAVDSSATLPVEPLPVCVTLAEADLAVTAGSLTPWTVDQATTVPFTVVNHGPSGDAGASVALDVPAGLRVDDLTPAGFQCTAPGGAAAPVAGPVTLTCVPVDGAGDVRTIDVGAPEPLVLGVTPTAVSTAPVCFAAVISGPMYDRVPANNEDDVCQAVRPAGSDMGDAPNSYGTTLAANGPTHAPAGPRLGAAFDVETDGQPTPGADGDDTTGDADEDGVEFNPALGVAGGISLVQDGVANEVAVEASTAGFVNGWVDFNGDGDFADTGERFAADVAVAAGASTLPLTVPTSVRHGSTYARFRFTTQAGQATTPGGAAPDGEVEDYQVYIATPVPDACGAGLINPGFEVPDVHGPTPFVAQFGPDIKVYEDEFVPGWNDASGLVEIWRDGTVFDGLPAVPAYRGGQFAEFGGGYFQDIATIPGTTLTWRFAHRGRLGQDTVRLMLGAVPPAGGTFTDNFRQDATTGNTGWQVYTGSYTVPAGQFVTRVQFQAIAAAGGFGLAVGNFLDDVTLGVQCIDLGDAPASYGTDLAGNGPRHDVVGYDATANTADLMLGAGVDIENDGVPSAGLDGDDNAGVDDEDAVAGPIELTTGQPTTVTVSATNDTDQPATLVGWIDLDGDGAFEAAERVVVPVPAGSGADDYELVFPAGTATADTAARFRLFPGTVAPAGASPTGPAAGGEVEDHVVLVGAAELEIEKTSDATADTRPGDTVTYTVTATNVGDRAYTAANPARVWDDLSGVLDDATYAGGATADVGDAPVFASPVLSWTGALGVDDTVTIEYQVTVKGGGDGTVRNVAFAQCDPADDACDRETPECDPPVGGVDPDSGKPCAEVEFELPKLTIRKTSSRTELPAVGQPVTYTVTVTNEGPGDYTAAAPATMADDLSDVLDDATLDVDSIDATVGEADFASPELVWEGVLEAGDFAVITYTLVYTGAGDQVLVNDACVPVEEAQDPQDPCASVDVPGSGLDTDKVADPASGTAVEVGAEITYTLRFTNTGQTAASVHTFDDLAGVLDDAELVAGSIDADTGLTATFDGPGERIVVTGSVPVGGELEVTYRVRVLPFAAQDDHVLRNALQCQAGDPPTCEPDETVHPVRALDVEKSSTRTADTEIGDTVEYTVTATNIGEADYTLTDPALVRDTLAGVLDDATYEGDAAADQSGVLGYVEPVIRWEGALGVDDTVTITYSVTLTGEGDLMVRNVAWGGPGTSPECDPPTDDGVDPDTGQPCAEVEFGLPVIVDSKSVTPASGATVVAGDQLTYELTFSNDGTAAGQVDRDDVVTDVLDDAVLVTGPTTSDPALTATLSGGRISVTGTLAADQTVTVSYTVEVKPDAQRAQEGNDLLGNFLVDDGELPPAACQEGDTDCTVNPVPRIVGTKSVTPGSGTKVTTGQELRYTLTFTNEGTAAGDVDKVDHLANVLDDATLVSGPTVSDPALTATGPQNRRIAITGTLQPDQTVTVTYTVLVKPWSRQGDHRLGNWLLDQGQTPPQQCATSDSSTCNPVSRFDLDLDKTVVSGGKVRVGDRVRYRLVVSNKGPDAAPGPITLTDPLPRGLELRSASGKGWKCKAQLGADRVTCVRTATLGPDRKAPPVYVVATATRAAVGRTVRNVASVSALGDRNAGNDRDNAGIRVTAPPPAPSTGFRLWMRGAV